MKCIIHYIIVCSSHQTFFLTFDFHKDTKLTVKFRGGILINCEWNPLSLNVCESNWGYCVMLNFLYKMRFRSIFFSWQLHRNTIEMQKPNNIILHLSVCYTLWNLVIKVTNSFTCRTNHELS